MLSKISNIVKDHQDDIILVVGVFLVSLLSFAMGYLVAKNQEKTPIRFEQEPEYNEAELKKRIAQMLLVGFRGTEVSENSYVAALLKDMEIGGIVLFDYDVPSETFPRNIISPRQTEKLISALQEISSLPLFIAVDAEGGKINRLKKEYGFEEIPSAAEMGKQTPEETRIVAQGLAQQLFGLGINMNLAPVVDVNINPSNPIIGRLERSFSSDPEKVVLYAEQFIRAHLENNVIPVLKHFPGHGSSKGDTHYGIVDITDSWKQEELTPYKKLVDLGLADVIMTAHIINQNYDGYPATLSSIFLEDVLRQEIEFDGLIVSDDMQMKAVVSQYGFREAVIKAVNAGIDLMVLSNNIDTYDENLPYQTRDIILEATKKGEIKEERIIESSERIYSLKRKFGIID